MLRVALGKTLNMLNPEEIAPEIRLTVRDGQPPGQHDKHAAQDRKPAKNQHLFPALLGDDPRQHADHRYRQRQKAFGHHPHAAGQPKQHIAPRFSGNGLGLWRQPEAAHRRHQPQGNNGVQHRIGADAIHQEQGQEDKAGENGRPLIPPEPPGHPDNQQRREPRGEDRPGAYGKVRVAEQQLPDAVDPVAGDRLFKVAQPQEMRDDPVTRRQHFAADFRIARFIRLPQQADIDRNEVVNDKQCEKRYAITGCFHGTELTVC